EKSMNKYYVFLFSIIFIVSSANSAELTEKSKIRENIAVVDFEGKDVPASEASIFTDFLRTELVKTGTFNVVEKANMEKILREVVFQQTGVTSTDDAVNMGKILNVRKMVMGSVSKLKETYYITANLIDVESAKIDKSETLNCGDTNEFAGIASDLSEKFSGVVIIERMANAKKVWIVFSPKMGYFSPLDPKVNKHHNGNLSLEADISFFKGNYGLNIGYFQYDDEGSMHLDDLVVVKAREYLRNYLTGEYNSTTRYSKELLSLQSIDFGFIRKFARNQFDYFYGEIGLGKFRSSVNDSVYPNVFSKDFTTYFVKWGYNYKDFGAILKYSYSPTSDGEWSDVDFGGISLFLNYNFTTAINLY
ncbi:MAG: CsgG/HfaB family protein, partial [Elusimicrobiota bacterium]